MERNNSFYKNHPDLEVQDMFGEYTVKEAKYLIENADNVYIDFCENKLGIKWIDLFVTFDSGDYIGDMEAKLTVALSEYLAANTSFLSADFEKDNEEFLKSKGIL